MAHATEGGDSQEGASIEWGTHCFWCCVIESWIMDEAGWSLELDS